MLLTDQRGMTSSVSCIMISEGSRAVSHSGPKVAIDGLLKRLAQHLLWQLAKFPAYKLRLCGLLFSGPKGRGMWAGTAPLPPCVWGGWGRERQTDRSRANVTSGGQRHSWVSVLNPLVWDQPFCHRVHQCTPIWCGMWPKSSWGFTLWFPSHCRHTMYRFIGSRDLISGPCVWVGSAEPSLQPHLVL